MDEKTTSREELLGLVKKLIEDSPVLLEQEEIKKALLSVYQQLEQSDLHQLLELLQAEKTDWEAYFKNLEEKRKQILDQASQESLKIQNEGKKELLKEEEVFTHEEDESKAEDLLNQL